MRQLERKAADERFESLTQQLDCVGAEAGTPRGVDHLEARRAGVQRSPTVLSEAHLLPPVHRRPV